MYDPWALPETGFAAAAAVKSSCIRPGEPMRGEVAYTVNTKVRIIAKRTVVCVLCSIVLVSQDIKGGTL